MREWWGHLLTEWRLSIRGVYLWMLLFVGASHAWLVHSVNQEDKSLGLYIHQFEFMFMGALSILAVLSGVYGARRDRMNGVDQLLGSMPYSSVKRWSAKVIVFTIPFVLFALTPVVIYLWIWQTQFPEVSVYPVWFLMSTIIPMLYAVILGWLLGGLLRSRFGYFIGFLLFFLHIYGGLLLIVPNLPKAFRLLPNFLLLDYKSMGYFNDLWGFSRDLSFWLHRGFYLFLAAALFFLFVFAVSRIRKEPGILRNLALGFLSIVAAVSCLTGHIVMKSDLTELSTEVGYVMSADRASQYKNVSKTQQPIIDYELAIEPYGSGSIRVGAIMGNLDAWSNNADSTMSLTLHALFEVESVKAGDRRLTFERTDNKLIIELPENLDKGIEVEIVYKGAIADYHLTSDGQMIPIHEANGWKVNLPGDFEWYPQEASGQYSPRSVTVTYPDGIKLFSNFDIVERTVEDGRQVIAFESRDHMSFNLWGGALKELTVNSDGYYTKAIVNELVDEDYARKQIDIFHSANQMIVELYQPKGLNKAATLLPLDWIESNEKDNRFSQAGYYHIRGYLFNGLYPEDQVVSMMITTLVESNGLFSAPLGPENEEIFKQALSAYLMKRLHGDDYSAEPPSEYRELIEPILSYIKNHNGEEIERLLRDLYNELSHNGTAVPDIAALLKGEG